MIRRLPFVIVLVGTVNAGSAAPAVAQSALGTIAQSTIADFRALGSQEVVTLLSIGAVSGLIGHSADQQMTRSLSSPALEGTFQFGETIGGARMQFAAAVATFTAGRMTGNAKTAAIGRDLIRAQIVTQTLTAGIKMAATRTRPDGTQFSFPSGHSSVTFATATVLQRHLGWKVGIPAYGLASYVAASRVHTRRHFFSDVVVGAAIGIAAGRTVTIGVGRGKLAMAPVAAPGHASINFSWINRQ
jgi:membrane-associated phospholipid phosphatase